METAEETCECASLGDAWAMWGATGPLEGLSTAEQEQLRALVPAQVAACKDLHLLFLPTEGGASF